MYESWVIGVAVCCSVLHFASHVSHVNVWVMSPWCCSVLHVSHVNVWVMSHWCCSVLHVSHVNVWVMSHWCCSVLQVSHVNVWVMSPWCCSVLQRVVLQCFASWESRQLVSHESFASWLIHMCHNSFISAITHSSVWGSCQYMIQEWFVSFLISLGFYRCRCYTSVFVFLSVLSVRLCLSVCVCLSVSVSIVCGL